MSSNKCRQCGLVNFAGATECRRCNTPVVWGAEADAARSASSEQPAANYVAAGVYPQHEPGPAYPSQTFLPTPEPYSLAYEPRPKLRTGQAIASLVLGIIGLPTAGLAGFGSVIGLGLGIRAAIKAKKLPNVYGARGVAIGGIVTNSLSLLSLIPIAIVASLVISNINKIRMADNEINAIEHMYQIAGAEAAFQATTGVGESFGEMNKLIEEGLLPTDSASKYGYRFTIRVLNRKSTDDSVVPSFEVVGVPQSYGWSGTMSFYTSDQGEVRYADRRGAEARSIDDPVGVYYDELRDPFASRRTTSRGRADD